MDNKLLKSILSIITYCIVLIVVVVKFDLMLALAARLLHALRPVFWGIAIAFVLNRPFVALSHRLQRTVKKKNATALSIAIVYVLFVSVLLSILIVIIPALAQNLKTLSGNLGTYSATVQNWLIQIASFFGLELEPLHPIDVPDLVQKLPDLLGGLIPKLFDVTTNIILSIINIVLGFVLSIYLLFQKDNLLCQTKRLLYRYTKKRFADRLVYVMHTVSKTFTGFVTGQLTEAMILGILCFVGMLIFRFEYAFLISVLIAVTGLIPVVGAYIGAIVSAFLLAMADPLHALWFLIFLLVLQNLEGNLIYPKVVGESIGLPGVWVLVAITMGGALFGVIGMLLAVPTTSVVYQLIRDDVDQYEDLQRKANQTQFGSHS